MPSIEWKHASMGEPPAAAGVWEEPGGRAKSEITPSMSISSSGLPAGSAGRLTAKSLHIRTSARRIHSLACAQVSLGKVSGTVDPARQRALSKAAGGQRRMDLTAVD